VLATASKTIAPVAVDRRTYPSFQHWSDKRRQDPKPFAIDRFRVELRGDRIVATLNGQEAFDVRDGALKQGTVGLWCRGGAAFDNVRVGPVK
jgi:hypothetical protein